MKEEVFSLKAKFGLVAFGLALSLIIGEIFLALFFRAPKGTEFGTIDDVRRAMLAPTKEDAVKGAGDQYESGNLRGLVAPHPDDKIIYDLLPNLDITFQRARVKTNSCGMRSPERPIAKPANTRRVALLGDSFAFGWGVEQRESFAQVIEDTLNRTAKGDVKYEVLNFGVPGYSTFQEVAKFEETGLAFNPDAVLVFFVENDFGFPFYVRDVYNPGTILDSVKFAKLTWRAFDPRLEEEKLKLTSYDPNRALARLADVCKERGIELFVAINPKKDWKRHKKKLWVLKERGGEIHSLEIRKELLEIVESQKIAEEALTLSFDPHPSPLRHRIYGELLASHMMENLP